MSRDWMQSLCKQREGSQIAYPFGLVWRQKEWDCACDGSALLLLLGRTYPTRTWTDMNAPDLLEKAECFPVRHVTTFAKLMNWADPTPDMVTPPGITASQFLITKFYDRWVDRRLVWKMLARTWNEGSDCAISVRLGETQHSDIYLVTKTWRLIFCPCTEPTPDQKRGADFPPPDPNDLSMFEL